MRTAECGEKDEDEEDEKDEADKEEKRMRRRFPQRSSSRSPRDLELSLTRVIGFRDRDRNTVDFPLSFCVFSTSASAGQLRLRGRRRGRR